MGPVRASRASAGHSHSLITKRFIRIGPHVQGVLQGKSVARQDDLLMFERLGEERLPEETYHVS